MLITRPTTMGAALFAAATQLKQSNHPIAVAVKRKVDHKRGGDTRPFSVVMGTIRN